MKMKQKDLKSYPWDENEGPHIALVMGKGELGERSESGDIIDSDDGGYVFELARWSIEDEAKAYAELAKYRNEYRIVRGAWDNIFIDACEYALIFAKSYGFDITLAEDDPDYAFEPCRKIVKRYQRGLLLYDKKALPLKGSCE